MQVRDEEFLNKRLNSLRQDVRGIKNMNLSATNQPSQPPVRIAKSEFYQSNRMIPPIDANGQQINNPFTPRPGQPEIFSIEEYRMKLNSDQNPGKTTILSQETSTGKSIKASSVFEEIYQRIDPNPGQGQFNRITSSLRDINSQKKVATPPVPPLPYPQVHSLSQIQELMLRGGKSVSNASNIFQYKEIDNQIVNNAQNLSQSLSKGQAIVSKNIQSSGFLGDQQRSKYQSSRIIESKIAQGLTDQSAQLPNARNGQSQIDLASQIIQGNLNANGQGTNRSRASVIEVTEKKEIHLFNHLNNNLTNETENNAMLIAEVEELKATLQAEQVKANILEEQCRKEHQDIKEREVSTSQGMAEMQRKLTEVAKLYMDEETMIARIRGEIERERRENEVLRNELKRIGDITGDKILELENNMNCIARMRELEIENFSIEKENVMNTGEFVLEQMKLKFNDRINKMEDQIKTISIERDKLLAQGKSLLDLLKAFNANADVRMTQILNTLREEQEMKNKSELDELSSKIKSEEEHLNINNRRNQEIYSRLQAVEREAKARIIGKKNEGLRLKEELASLEQQFNKFLVDLNCEEKDFEKRQLNLSRLEIEQMELKEKTELIEKRYNEELETIKASNHEDTQDLESQLASTIAEEQRLRDEINAVTKLITDFQKQHNELVGNLHNNLNKALHSGQNARVQAHKPQQYTVKTEEFEEFNY